MARFSQLGIDLSDEMVIENISFSLSQIGEQASLAKLSEQTKEKSEKQINKLVALRP